MNEFQRQFHVQTSRSNPFGRVFPNRFQVGGENFVDVVSGIRDDVNDANNLVSARRRRELQTHLTVMHLVRTLHRLERKRERERERLTDRQTDKDRQTDRERQTETDRDRHETSDMRQRGR